MAGSRAPLRPGRSPRSEWACTDAGAPGRGAVPIGPHRSCSQRGGSGVCRDSGGRRPAPMGPQQCCRPVSAHVPPAPGSRSKNPPEKSPRGGPAIATGGPWPGPRRQTCLRSKAALPAGGGPVKAAPRKPRRPHQRARTKPPGRPAAGKTPATGHHMPLGSRTSDTDTCPHECSFRLEGEVLRVLVRLNGARAAASALLLLPRRSSASTYGAGGVKKPVTVK